MYYPSLQCFTRASKIEKKLFAKKIQNTNTTNMRNRDQKTTATRYFTKLDWNDMVYHPFVLMLGIKRDKWH